MRSRLFSAVSTLLVLALGLTAAMAQYRGSLQGTVTDAQGAVVSGATVTLTDKETNRQLTAVTSETGVYNIGALPPSRYTLSVGKNGFKKKVLEDVGIISEQINAVNVVLDLGQVSETVTVNGDSAPLLDTQTASLSGTVNAQEVQTLPAYGRDVFQLLQLAPGAFADGSQAAGGGTNNLPSRNGPGGPGATSGIFSVQNTPAVSIGGGRQELTDIQIDGVGATDATWGGTSIVTPNLDSVKEVKVVTNSYDAEDGRYSAGAVKVITQNGTNHYHGSAHWRADRAGFNAYQKYNGVNPATKNTTRLNDFGGSIGGPILRNKLFGFFSYETIHSSGGVSTAGWFETPQFRTAAPTGSVSALMMNYKGVSPVHATVQESASDPTPKDCTFAQLSSTYCAFIPGQGLDLGSPLTSGLGTPDPSFVDSTSPGFGNGLDGIADIQFMSLTFSQPLVEQQFQARVDYNLSNKDLIAFSFFHVPNSQTLSNGANGFARGMNFYHADSKNQTGTVIWDHTFSPTMQNEFRANVGGWRENTLKENPGSPWGLPILEIQNSVDGQGIGVLGSNAPTWGIATPLEFDQWTYAGKDVLTKVQHSHTLKMGGEVTRLLFLDAAPWNARPTYNFNNMWDMLNDAPVQEFGTFNPQNGVPSDFRFDSRETLRGFFIQDSYKLRPNLTLTLGMRWDYFGPVSEKKGHLPVVELGQGSDVISGIKIRTGGNLFNSQKNNFGPQLGFAWDPSAFKDRLVVRGGFGIGYTALQEANSLDGRNNPPFLSSFLNVGQPNIVYGVNSLPTNPTSFYGYASNPVAVIPFDPSTHLPLPGGTPVNLVAYQNNWPTTRAYRYSMDLQYDLGREWVATLGYQGTASRHLTRLYNGSLFQYARLATSGQGLKAFNPLVQSLTMYDDGGYGNFNALLAGVRHRFSRSFQLESQYRWSKGLDTGSNNYSPAQHNGACSCGGGSYVFTMNNEYGPSDFDVRHTFKLFGIWSPTLFRGGKSSLEKVFGGWSLSGILNAHSGYPWNPYDQNLGFNSVYAGSANVYGGGGPLRPGYYLGGYRTGNFKTPGNASLFPDTNPQTGEPCYVDGPNWSDIIAGNALPGPIPCKPGIGRNSFAGPGYFDIDTTIGKAFGLPSNRVLGENAKLVFNANFYNLFNKVNLANVDGNVRSSTFGEALNGLSGRTIDFQLRLSF